MSMNMNGEVNFMVSVKWVNQGVKGFWIWAHCFKVKIEVTDDHQIINVVMNIFKKWLKLFDW